MGSKKENSLEFEVLDLLHSFVDKVDSCLLKLYHSYLGDTFQDLAVYHQ